MEYLKEVFLERGEGKKKKVCNSVHFSEGEAEAPLNASD